MIDTLVGIGNGIAGSFTDGIFKLLSYFLQLILTPINAIISGIAELVGGTDVLTYISSALSNFFEIVFDWFDYIRSVCLIDSFCMNCLCAILIMKFVMKPAIAGIKMLIKWWSSIH